MRAGRGSLGAPRVLAVILALLACVTHAGEIDWTRIQDEGTELLSKSIRLDTTNPPGNELVAARLLAAHLEREGIAAELFESDPGRASVLARLPGRGKKRPIVLLNHLDVVLANASEWRHPPFGGEVVDGYVHGRGAIDCKGMGVVEAMAMIALKRSGEKLDRDILFLGTADEETGGQRGAGWFVEHHFDELGGPEFLLNEGGYIRAYEDGGRVFEVAVAEKTPMWLRLTANGEAGHGSTPPERTAVTRLVRALARVREHRPAIKVVPQVGAYYSGLAQRFDAEKRERYRNLAHALENPSFRAEFLADPRDAALVQNTIAMTVLEGSEKTNVIPATASAELDCRLLPGEDPEAFMRELRSVIDDDEIEMKVLLNFPPSSSPHETPLYRAIASVASEQSSLIVPAVLRGFTDSHFFREKGVVSYGFIPVVLGKEDGQGVHGLDERLSQQNIGSGARTLLEILRALDRES